MIIWAALLLAIGGVCVYKSKQAPMTKEEQEYELHGVSKRAHSFLTNTTKHKPYNGVE